MTFGPILSRGVSAANRSITGLVLLFLLFGLFQGAAVVIGGLSPADSMQFLPVVMGFGCFVCFWLLIIVSCGPWVAGGVIGQLRDRIERPGDVPRSFSDYGGRCYLRLLALTLILFVTVIVLSLIVGLVAWAIMFEQFGGMPRQPAQFQQFQTHPAGIAATILGRVLMCAINFMFILAGAIAVIEYMDSMSALGQAFDFIRRHVGDAARLIGVIAAIDLVIWGIGLIPMLFDIHYLPVLLVLGLFAGVFYPYTLLLNLAWSVSLWLARKPPPPGEERAAPEPSTSDEPAIRPGWDSADSQT